MKTLEQQKKESMVSDYKNWRTANKRYQFQAGWDHAVSGIESQSADPDYMHGYGKGLNLVNVELRLV